MLLFDYDSLMKVTNPTEMLNKIRSMIWPLAGISLISILFITILHYYVIYNPIDSTVTIFTSAYKSLHYYLLYLIIIVLFSVFASIAMIFGLMLLVIGIFFAVIYVMTIHFFILPVLMTEGPYIANAISRSFTLAHRHFWQNIGWVAVFFAIILVVSIVLNTLIMLPFTGEIMNSLTNPEEAVNTISFVQNPAYIVLSALTSALIYPLFPILGTILYFNGRAREEEITLPEGDSTI